MANATKKAESLAKIMKDVEKILADIGVDSDKVKKAMDNIAKSTAKTKNEAAKLKKELAGNVKEVAGNIKQLDKAGGKISEMSEGAADISNLWKSSGKNLKDNIGKAQGFSDKIKNIMSLSKGTGKNLGIAGKALSGMGVAAGGLAKAMPAIFAVKTVFDFANKVDRFIKTMNKNFATMRGPEIMNADVNRQFRDFGLAVTNLGENIRDGLQSGQVMEFMESMSQAGLRVGTLNEGLLRYRDVVHVAAKASKVLGIEMVAAGGMMTDMMINLRMNLKDVNDAFVAVAFDAEKSGLSTDKFWNAVKNATVSLAFYGKYLQGISNITKEFGKTQVAGADDALETSERMMKSFKDMDISQKLAFRAMAKRGGVDFKKAFGDAAKAAEGELSDIESKISVATTMGDTKALEKLEREKAAQQVKMTQLLAAEAGGMVAQAQMLPALTDKAGSLMIGAIKGTLGQNLTKLNPSEGLLALTQAIQGMGWQVTEMDVRTMINMAKEQANMLKNSLDSMKTGNDLNKDVIDVLDSGKDLNEKGQEKMVEQLMSVHDISAEQARAQVTLIAGNKDIRSGFSKLLKSDATDFQENLNALKELVDNQDVGSTLLKAGFGNMESGTAKAEKAYDNTFEKIRNNTMSMDDLKQMTKDAAMGQLMYLNNISNLVGQIANHMLSKRRTKEQKEAFKSLPKDIQKEVNRVGATESMMLAQQKVDASSKIMSGSQTGLGVLKQFGKKGAAEAEISRLNKAAIKRPLNKAEKETISILEKAIEAKDFDKYVADENDRYNREYNQAKLDFAEAQKQTKALDLIDSKAKDQAKLLGASMMGDNMMESRKAYFDMKMEESGGRDIDPETLAPFERGMMMMEADRREKESKGSGWKTVGYGGGTVMGPQGQTIPVMGTKKVIKGSSKQGLKNPEMVTSPGPVVLHPNETILPAGLGNFKTTPMMGAGATPFGAGGGGKNITITVNATEKDLAQRIANEIRAVMYREQTTSQG